MLALLGAHHILHVSRIRVKRQVINLRSCCIFLVDSVESMMMHGLATPKFMCWVVRENLMSVDTAGDGQCLIILSILSDNMSCASHECSHNAFCVAGPWIILYLDNLLPVLQFSETNVSSFDGCFWIPFPYPTRTSWNLCCLLTPPWDFPEGISRRTLVHVPL